MTWFALISANDLMRQVRLRAELARGSAGGCASSPARLSTLISFYCGENKGAAFQIVETLNQMAEGHSSGVSPA